MLAGCGFAFAKALVIAHLLSVAWGGGLIPAMASAFGADAVVLLVLGLLGLAAQRVGRPVVTWTLWALAAVLGLYAILNVVLVIEIGRPLTVDMRWFGVGTDEAGAMIGSEGARLAMTGIVLYGLFVVPVVRSFERRPAWFGKRAALALAVYAVLAIGFVHVQPRVASIYGLHRNAVAVLALSAVEETGLLGVVASSGDLLPTSFTAPESAEWTAPITWDRSVRPKHVVLWFQESTGARYTSLFDPNAKTTPNALRLSEHALTFDRYYANCPLSEKAIFGILYGLHPYPANRPMASVNPRLARESLMETLTSRGYRAGFFTGALFGFGDKQKLLEERGFDVLVDGESVPNREQYWRNGWGIDDRAVVAEALRWLDDRPDPDQPQFIVMVTIVPHTPYERPPYAPRISAGSSRKELYDDVLAYGDSIFGEFYAELEKRGLADDTLVVWTGDHGEGFEQHPGNLSHGSFVYEENVHVPLMFVQPRMFPTRMVSQRMGSHVDLMPTILDLLGEPIPEDGDGQSLVADDFAYRPLFTVSFMRDHLGGVRDGHYKYIYNFDTGYEELFDLSVDPLETDNIVHGFDIEQIGTWRLWVTEHQARQKVRLDNWPAKGPSYLRRILEGMRVYVEDGDERLLCRVPRMGLRAMGCEGQPDFVSVGPSREMIRQVTRECLTVHPPDHGTLVVEFPPLDPMPTFLGAGLLDSARKLGGAPLEITWRVGDQQPVVMTLADPRIEAFETARLPRGGAPAPVRIEVRSDDWTNRQGCLILSP